MTPTTHPFIERPHRTLLALMFPVLLSLIAEPITGLVDTAFVSQLGTEPLAALGVATTALSTMFWIFNFLTIGTQTQISQAVGAGKSANARQMVSLALVVGWVLSVLVIVVFYPLADIISGLLGAEGDVREMATIYTRIRLLGTPAVFTLLVCFGVLRGDQNMRTPSIIAVGVNAFNIILDYPLIFGFGDTIPPMGVAGAALASTLSQYIGAAWALTMTLRRFGFSTQFDIASARDLFEIGGNLFVRTSLLTVFLAVSTSVANQIGAESGAAHQVIRQIYVVTALSLDAFAVSAQSLVGYFLGADNRVQARRAAIIAIWWALATGFILSAITLIATPLITRLMVPEAAISTFLPAWYVVILALPISSIAFSTDGIHMGTSDYAFLRNVMFISTAAGIAVLLMIPRTMDNGLMLVWVATIVWVLVRSILGLVRIFAPQANAPLVIATAKN